METNIMFYGGANECKPLPPLDFLKECFEYDPENGTLKWKTRPRSHFLTEAKWKAFNKRYPGKEAGCRHTKKNGKKAYIQVHVSNIIARKTPRSMLLVNRICAAMGGREITAHLFVDHANGDIWDHRLLNLRVATRSQSSMNIGPHSDKIDKTMPIGVFKNKKGGNYSARVGLGTFPTKELAHEAVCKAKRLFHGEFARFS